MHKHMLGTCFASHPMRPRTRRYSYSATTYYSNELYAKRGIYLICIPFLPIFLANTQIGSRLSLPLAVRRCFRFQIATSRRVSILGHEINTLYNLMRLLCLDKSLVAGTNNKSSLYFVSNFSRVDRTRFARLAISTRKQTSLQMRIVLSRPYYGDAKGATVAHWPPLRDQHPERVLRGAAHIACLLLSIFSLSSAFLPTTNEVFFGETRHNKLSPRISERLRRNHCPNLLARDRS